MIAASPRERAQAAMARGWLTNISIPPDATEAQIQRLFGVCASLVLEGEFDPASALHQLQRLVAQIQSFVWFHYTGDPVFALAVHRMLVGHDVVVASLGEYYDGCRNIAVPQADHLDVQRGLFLDLSDQNHTRPGARNVAIPPISSLVQDGRSALLGVCQTIMAATSCGTRPLSDRGDLPDILPKLCCSYAADWDLAATCILVRTCAYLGLSGAPACRQATCWLLNQQRLDGRFGLLVPQGCHDRPDMREMDSDVLATTDVLWTLAEIRNPGFMLETVPTLGGHATRRKERRARLSPTA